MIGPCLELAERRARAYVRSNRSAATGLTGLDVCLWRGHAFLVQSLPTPRRGAICGTIDLQCLVQKKSSVGDASIFIDAGGGVRNLIVQAEMSGNAKITVVGEVSGGITVASMSDNAKIEAGS